MGRKQEWARVVLKAYGGIASSILISQTCQNQM